MSARRNDATSATVHSRCTQAMIVVDAPTATVAVAVVVVVSVAAARGVALDVVVSNADDAVVCTNARAARLLR